MTGVQTCALPIYDLRRGLPRRPVPLAHLPPLDDVVRRNLGLQRLRALSQGAVHIQIGRQHLILHPHRRRRRAGRLLRLRRHAGDPVPQHLRLPGQHQLVLHLTHAGACWVRIGEGEWQDLSETYGILNLEALIQSDNLPQNDLELTAASIEDTYIVSGTPFTVKYSVHNAGMLPVDSYTLVISDEENGLSQSHTVTCDLQHDVRQEFTELFSFDGLEPEKDYNFTLKIEKPNGKDDESPSNNEMAMEKIASINGTFARSVLIEEFTTESCPNCPPAAKIGRAHV